MAGQAVVEIVASIVELRSFAQVEAAEAAEWPQIVGATGGRADGVTTAFSAPMPASIFERRNGAAIARKVLDQSRGRPVVNLWVSRPVT